MNSRKSISRILQSELEKLTYHQERTAELERDAETLMELSTANRLARDGTLHTP
jgi:hypothetical protein